MHHTTISNLAGRDHLHISVFGSGGADPAQQARRAMEDALAALEAGGAQRAHVVRSRLFARDAQTRRLASDLRLKMLDGALRGASSSYIDPARLPVDAAIAIELVVLRSQAPAEKTVREYEPRIAPPMFVVLDGVVHLSGVTDVTEGFDAQLRAIGARVRHNLAEAGSDMDRVCMIAAHVSRTVDAAHAWRSILAAFGSRTSVTMSFVDGYSAPEKLVEIETTALA